MKQLVFAAALVILAAPAQEIRLSTGAVDNQVFQRNAAGNANLKLGGPADILTGKAKEARLTPNAKPVRGFGWKPLTTVATNTWAAELTGIPAGGPYTLELRAPGATPVSVRDLLVGDLWILAG